MLQEFDELYIGLLRRDVAINQAEAERESGSPGEIRLDKFWPFGGDGFRDFCITISGQVGEVHLGLLALWGVGYREKIDGARTSGSG